MKHRYIVTVDCSTREQADTVMVERTAYDEDYGFPYTLEYLPELHQGADHGS